MQHMVLSLSTRVRGDLSVQSLSEICAPTGQHSPVYTVTVPYAVCIQCVLLKMSI